MWTSEKVKFTGFVWVIFFLTASLNAQSTSYVTLAGFNQVPEVRTPGQGFLEITVAGDSLFVSGEFSDLRSPYHSAYIHFGKEGKTGNRLFRLSADVSEDYLSGTFNKKENRFKLTNAIINHLRNGMLYVNISSHDFQRGEIRGQIPSMNIE